MTTNTSLIPDAPQSPLVLCSAKQNVIGFLGPLQTKALSYTCKYFEEFLQTEVIRGIMLGVHFPFYKRPSDLSARSAYEKLVASRSKTPGVVCCQTIPIKDGMLGKDLLLTHDSEKVITHESNLMCLYELNTGDRIWEFPALNPWAHLAISPDGTILLKSDSNLSCSTLDFINAETGKSIETEGRVHTFSNDKPTQCMQISSDGKYAYVADQSHITHFNLATGKCIQTLPIPEELFGYFNHTKHMLQNGSMTISAFKEGQLVLWQMDTAKVLLHLKGHPRSGDNFYFDAHGLFVRISLDKTRAVSLWDDSFMRVWDLKTGVCLHTLKTKRLGDDIIAMEATPDLKYAVACSTHQITLIDLEKGSIRQTFECDYIYDLQIKPDGTGCVAKIWNGQCVALKVFSFCELPEERLTKLATTNLWFTQVNKQAFSLLPKFAQGEIGKIQTSISKQSHFVNGTRILPASRIVNIYNALNLQPIRRLLIQAKKQPPNLALTYLSEARARIDQLPPPIRDEVYKNFQRIQIRKETFNGRDLFATRVEDISDGIDAITATIAEFKSQIPNRQEGKED